MTCDLHEGKYRYIPLGYVLLFHSRICLGNILFLTCAPKTYHSWQLPSGGIDMSRCHLVSNWLRFWTIANLFSRSSAFQSVLFDSSIGGSHQRSLPAARRNGLFISEIGRQRSFSSFRRSWRSRPSGLRMVELYRNDAEVSFVRTYYIALSPHIIYSVVLSGILSLKKSKARNRGQVMRRLRKAAVILLQKYMVTGYRTPWV